MSELEITLAVMSAVALIAAYFLNKIDVSKWNKDNNKKAHH
jgi:hypothetical protein